jgi:uncharacterized protein YukE
VSQSEIHVDPDRLQALAEELRKFSSAVNTELTLLDNELRRLGRSWQDEEYVKFKAAIQPLRGLLGHFHQEILRTTPDMLADAETIRRMQRKELS